MTIQLFHTPSQNRRGGHSGCQRWVSSWEHTSHTLTIHLSRSNMTSRPYMFYILLTHKLCSSSLLWGCGFPIKNTHLISSDILPSLPSKHLFHLFVSSSRGDCTTGLPKRLAWKYPFSNIAFLSTDPNLLYISQPKVHIHLSFLPSESSGKTPHGSTSVLKRFDFPSFLRTKDLELIPQTLKGRFFPKLATLWLLIEWTGTAPLLIFFHYLSEQWLTIVLQKISPGIFPTKLVVLPWTFLQHSKRNAYLLDRYDCLQCKRHLIALI